MKFKIENGEHVPIPEIPDYPMAGNRLSFHNKVDKLENRVNKLDKEVPKIVSKLQGQAFKVITFFAIFFSVFTLADTKLHPVFVVNIMAFVLGAAMWLLPGGKRINKDRGFWMVVVSAIVICLLSLLLPGTPQCTQNCVSNNNTPLQLDLNIYGR